MAVNPDEAVARGAAVYARYLLAQRDIDANAPKLRIMDVNSHSLGIEGVNLQTLHTENIAIIPRNTPLPFEIKRTFVTRTDNQPRVKVQLLEGESSLPSHCSRLATATIRNLPPGLPKGTPIDVRYSLQSNGRLVVRAVVPGHGEDAEIELQRVRGLADRRVQGWKRIVCRDGRYRDFAEALASLSAPDASIESDPLGNDGDKARLVDSTTKSGLEPAVSFGAPRAAADTLQAQFGYAVTNDTSIAVTAGEADSEWRALEQDAQHRLQHKRKLTKAPFVVNLLGHVVASLLGLFIGYYILCWLRPDLNHFELNLPGIRPYNQDGR